MSVVVSVSVGLLLHDSHWTNDLVVDWFLGDHGPRDNLGIDNLPFDDVVVVGGVSRDA